MPRANSLAFVLAAAVAAAPLAARAQAPDSHALRTSAPEEAFGEHSYYDAYPKMDPEDLISQDFWMTCWAFTDAEAERLKALARDVEDEALEDELTRASAHYQIARIRFSELVRGTAIHEGDTMSSTNEAYVYEQQALIGGAPQWIARNAADCIERMPDPSMPDFAELYPWLATGMGTGYRN